MKALPLLLMLFATACRTASPEVVRGDVGARLDEALMRLVPFGMSGSVLVADRNGVVLSKGYGVADVRRGTPIDSSTVFDMGSITKGFTATALALLEHEGRVAYNDTLPKYFDDVPADKRDITLHQLLTHTAGLVDLTGGDYDRVSREQLIRDVMRAPLVAPPGAEWHYSNAAFSLIAAIIEETSGRPYEAFMRERLFTPAGMRDTGYALPHVSEARVAHTLTPPVDHGTPTARLARAGGVHWVLLGNGGMLTTAHDLYRFHRALVGGVIVPSAVQEKLFAPRFARKRDVQAYGWFREKEGETLVYTHGGDAPQLGVNAELRHDADGGLFIAFLGNTRLNGWSTRRGVVPAISRIARGGQVDIVKVVPSDAASLRAHAGTYTLPDGSMVTVRVERDHLVAGATGQSAVDLFTIQRSDASLAARRRLNDSAAKLIETFDWSAAKERYGAFRDAVVLGTARRDRGVFLTTIRARFDRAEKVLRFTWINDEPVRESDDEELPSIGLFSESPIEFALDRPLWRESGDTFAFYDLYAGETIRVTFSGEQMTVGATTAIRKSPAR